MDCWVGGWRQHLRKPGIWAGAKASRARVPILGELARPSKPCPGPHSPRLEFSLPLSRSDTAGTLRLGVGLGSLHPGTRHSSSELPLGATQDFPRLVLGPGEAPSWVRKLNHSSYNDLDPKDLFPSPAT